MNALAIELQSYFTSFARDQRDLSPHTISSYRDTWRLLITYLSDTTGTRADRIDFADLTVESFTGFLDHLEHDRHNSTATRNARLSGIRAVSVHALPAQLDDAGTITRILAIPAKRHPTPQVEYLASDEADALIAAPDRSRWTGRHDHALLVLALQTGLRISELRSLDLNDIDPGVGAHVRCTGKGRRQRCTPLTSATTTIMSNYLAERATRSGSALFCGPHGARLSRDALEHRIRIHAATATRACPSLATKHVTRVPAYPAAHRGDEQSSLLKVSMSQSSLYGSVTSRHSPPMPTSTPTWPSSRPQSTAPEGPMSPRASTAPNRTFSRGSPPSE